MDIVSHAIAGAAVGGAFDMPLVGVLFAVMPDLVLPVKRVARPTAAYTASHSLVYTGSLGVGLWAWFGTPLPLLALLSHVLVDIPTHGKTFAPALLHPFSSRRYSLGADWEWGNRSWCVGLALTTIWSLLWITI